MELTKCLYLIHTLVERCASMNERVASMNERVAGMNEKNYLIEIVAVNERKSVSFIHGS